MADAELIGEIAYREDWEPELKLTKKNTTTRVKEPSTGGSGLNAWISLTEDGAAISTLTTALTEAAGLAGTYYGLVERATMEAGLAAYDGQTVYEVYDKTGDFRVSRPVKVVAVRRV